MGDLVSDDPPDGAVVHVARAVVREEDALKDAGGELGKRKICIECFVWEMED